MLLLMLLQRGDPHKGRPVQNDDNLPELSKAFQAVRGGKGSAHLFLNEAKRNGLSKQWSQRECPHDDPLIFEDLNGGGFWFSCPFLLIACDY
jgi:hypothetical protein